MIYKVVIAGKFYKNRTFPGLNEYLHECARHPQAGGRMKREYQMIAQNAIRHALKKLRIDKPILIKYRFYEADRKRDKGNIFSFADKVIEDALQVCGVIPNDGWAQIVNFEHEFYIDAKNPRIEFEIEEVG